jgi:antitoxin component HigA of HigAB toxin-antitoxin module
MKTTRETPDGYKIADSYAKLLARFPLWKITSEAKYDQATTVAQDLIGRRDLDADESAYLDALVILIGEYEDRQYPLDKLAAKLKPAGMLKHLIDANEVSQTEIAKVLNVGRSTVSMILCGARPITAEHARALGKRFGVEPGLFI